MNYGSLDTTLSKPSTPVLLTWDYTSEICRSWGGGVISWLTTPFRAFSLMSTANDFWREKEGGNCWSRWLSFSRLHIYIHILNILTNILCLFTFKYMYTCIKHLDQYFIWVRHHHYLMFFVRSRMTPQKTNLWISSRDTCEFPHVIYDVIFLWRHFDAVIMTSYFLTSFWRRHYDVIFLWRHFDAVIMTSYFCDVILTPSLWRHILWRHFDAVIMTSNFFDVILTPSLWRHIFGTSFPHRSYANDDEPCKSTENDTR
jgi:hypothetical protein